MYDIKWIRDQADRFDAGLQSRGLEPLSGVLLSLDDARRKAIVEAQGAQERRNAASKEIGQAMAAKDTVRADVLKAEVAALKSAGAEFDVQQKAAIAALDRALAEIPNTPLADVPQGRDEHDNVPLRVQGETPRFPDGFTPREHFELGEALGLLDFETAATLSGARFAVLKGGLARLERALGQFMLDLHTQEHGYQEISPPLLVREAAMFGTAQLPKFENDQFWALSGEVLARGAGVGDRYGLIPTAEVPLTNLVRETILAAEKLPLRFTACTPCFRAEAGAAGRDTRGLIRQHQFHKVELVSITSPEHSAEEHERMLGCAEAVLRRLGLHYRVMALCTGDMGFASQKTYDIEVWLPGQGRFREISSCSQCGDFQARRMGARFRTPDGKGPRFVHTLNGSGVAVGRALVAVMETYQNSDGTITVPDVLAPYMGGIARLEPAC